MVVGINPADLESHAAWARKYGLAMPLTVDEDLKVAAAYGALKPETNHITRTVVVIDKQGKVRWAVQGLPETETVLAELDKVNAPRSEPPGTGY